MKKILIISHDASRTGAPMLLLELIKWINKHKKFKISLLLLKEGTLLDDFSKEATIINYYKNVKVSSYKLKKFLANRNKKLFLNSVKPFDLIFSNTIVNGKVLEELSELKIPIVSYIHELHFSIGNFIAEGRAQGTLKHSDFLFCGSKLVQKTLIENYAIKKEKTKVVNSFVEALNKEKNKTIGDELRKELKIPLDALVVGMMGTFDWRKGNDLFIKTATLLQNETIYLVWVGADDKKEISKIKYDLKMSGSNPKIKLLASTPQYKKYYNLFDVFYLSSREDPYPMVMVEASLYGLPIICFKDAGGTQEFIDDKTGCVVPYGNIQKVVEKINYYNKNRNLLEENGNYIKEKSAAFHDVDKNAEIIYNKMTTVINYS